MYFEANGRRRHYFLTASHVGGRPRNQKQAPEEWCSSEIKAYWRLTRLAALRSMCIVYVYVCIRMYACMYVCASIYLYCKFPGHMYSFSIHAVEIFLTTACIAISHFRCATVFMRNGAIKKLQMKRMHVEKRKARTRAILVPMRSPHYLEGLSELTLKVKSCLCRASVLL